MKHKDIQRQWKTYTDGELQLHSLLVQFIVRL